MAHVVIWPGCLYWVKYGGFGEQVMIVQAVTDRRVYGLKYLKNSNRWTNRVSITRPEVLGPVYDNGTEPAWHVRMLKALEVQCNIKPLPPVKEVARG